MCRRRRSIWWLRISLDGRTAAHIKIVTTSAKSNEVVLGAQPSAPEIFLSPVVSFPGTAAILNQDGTLNSPSNPAQMGDTVAMFVSGVGKTTPAGVDGAIPTAAGGTPVLPIMVQLTIPPFGPFPTVTYAGNAPGLVSGVAQINFQIPSVTPIGPGPPYQAPVVLYVGGTASNGVGPVVWVE